MYHSIPTADGLMAGNSSRGKPMLSDSNLPTLDSAFERGQEQMVYIRPPLDSSLEHSINGGTCPADEGVEFEVKISPHYDVCPWTNEWLRHNS